jgi:hypothetical protein
VASSCLAVHMMMASLGLRDAPRPMPVRRLACGAPTGGYGAVLANSLTSFQVIGGGARHVTGYDTFREGYGVDDGT